VVEPFNFVLSWAGYREDKVRTPAAVARRHLGLRLVASLAREAFDRTDPQLRAVAQQTHPWRRFWLYQQLVVDRTGRVRQMVKTCHGLLVLAHTAHRWGGPAGKALCRRILAAVVGGERLPSLLRWSVGATFEPPLLPAFWMGPNLHRVTGATAQEAARILAARCLLVRRAGPLLSPHSLRCGPPARFAPEDIPADPLRNLHWFDSMNSLGAALDSVTTPWQREAMSAFVSANARLVLGWFHRRHRWNADAPADDPGSLRAGVQRLLRFAGATGRWPARAGNPRRYLAACDAWAREQVLDSPAGRLGRLLRRLPDLDLGDVVSVTGSVGGVQVDDVLGAHLPAGPLPEISSSRLCLTQLRTPESLAREGAWMRHCVATLLPRVLSGEVAVYAGTVAGERLTVAVSRSWQGTVELVDARGKENRLPTVAQSQLLGGWLASSEPTSTFPHPHPG
jgi:hypothetical protein